MRELNIGSLESTRILVCTEIIGSDNLVELSQNWQNILGIYIGIEDASYKDFMRRIESGEYSIALYPVKAQMGMSSLL